MRLLCWIFVWLGFSLSLERVLADDVPTIDLSGRLEFLNPDGPLSSALDLRSVRLEFISAAFGGPQAQADRSGHSGSTLDFTMPVPPTPPGSGYKSYFAARLADGGTYRFGPGETSPITATIPPTPLLAAETAGIIEIHFVNAAGAANVGRVSASSYVLHSDGGGSPQIVPSGRNSEGQAEISIAGPVSSVRLVARGGISQRVEIIFDVLEAGITYVHRHVADIVVPANDVVVLECPVENNPASSGRIRGRVDVSGESERPPTRVTVGLVALNGLIISIRTVDLPGFPASGEFTVPNLSPGSYKLNASFILGEGDRVESLVPSRMESTVTVSAGTETAVGDLLVIQPGYVGGNVVLNGIRDIAARPSPLRYLKVFPPDSAEYSQVIATGYDAASPGVVPTGNFGAASVNLQGGYQDGVGAFVGQYRLALGQSGNIASRWATSLSLIFQHLAPDQIEEHLSEQLFVTDIYHGHRDEPWVVTPGLEQQGDLRVGFGELCLILSSDRGPLWSPHLEAFGSRIGLDDLGQPVYHAYDLRTGSGLPTAPGSSRTASIHVLLPAGSYQAVNASATIDAGAGPAVVTFPIGPLDIVAGERRCLVDCVHVDLQLGACLQPGTNTARVVLRSCPGRPFRRVSWRLDDFPATDLCVSCGLGDDFSFVYDLPNDRREHRLTVAAEDSIGVSTDSKLLPPDITAPELSHCPADIVVVCAPRDGAVVHFASPTATDGCAGNVGVICEPQSGSKFPIGDTTVVCTATDPSGNRSHCSFHVRVSGGTVPPVRSTHYAGNASSGVRYDHESRFEPSDPAITLEAWVHREADGGEIQTIISRSYRRGYWFGFAGDRLRFYRRGIFEGNYFADSSSTVPKEQWAHVAVTFDGTRASFWVDGQSAGGGDVGPIVALPFAEPLWLGRDTEGFPLKGSLDEVRIWSAARTQEQLQEGMYAELTEAPGLLAVFPQGGSFEAGARSRGVSGAGSDTQIWGILPRDLVVPRAVGNVTLDGQIQRDSEYVGAEEMVIRHRDGAQGFADGRVFLVYRESGDGTNSPAVTNLYVAIQDLHPPLAGQLEKDSQVALFIDSNRSGGDAPEFGDAQLFSSLDGNKNGSLLGDGAAWVSFGAPARGGLWDVKTFRCQEFLPLCHEFRIQGALLDNFRDCVGFAVGQISLDPLGLNHMGPEDASPNRPGTWAMMHFGDNPESLPITRIAGRVIEAGTDLGLGGFRVQIVNPANGQLVGDTLVTDAAGDFTYVGPAPRGVVLSVQTLLPLAWRGADLGVLSGEGLIPAVESIPRQSFRYPACDATASCSYRRVLFVVRRPSGAITTSGFSPTNGISKVRLSTAPERFSPATRFTIQGENLHREIRVWLYDCYSFGLPPENATDLATYLAGQPACSEGDKYRELTVVSVAPDGHSAVLEMPELAVSDPSHDLFFLEKFWRLFLHDDWERPGYRAWQEIPGRFVELPPPFPWVHGFSFINEADVPAREAAGTVGLPGFANLEFEALFGKETHLGCFCDEPDPLYLSIYEPIYDSIMDVAASKGACTGLNATAQAFALGRLNPAQFDPTIRFGAGFSGLPSSSDTFIHPPKPARYGSKRVTACDIFGEDVGSCAGVGPANLWSQIRVNHGVILSWEFISALIDATDSSFLSGLSTGSVRGGQPRSIGNYLRERRNDPQGLLGGVLVIAKNFSESHSLTPYAIRSTADANLVQVMVYDSNDPGNAERHLDIDLAANSYRYEFAADDVWSGSGIWRIPLSVWLADHSFTSPLDALGGAVRFLLSSIGSADVLYTTPEGEWGWKGTERVDALPGAVTLPVPALSVYAMLTPPLLVKPMTELTARFKARGTNYGWAVSGAGVLWDLQMHQATPGAEDIIEVKSGQEPGEPAYFKGWDNAPFSRISVRPQLGIDDFRPTVVFEAPDDASRIIYQFSGLRMPTGGIGFQLRIDRAKKRIAIKNETLLPQTPRLTLVNSPSDGGELLTLTNTAIGLPLLPSGGMMVLQLEGDDLIVQTDLTSDGTFDALSRIALRTQPSPPALSIRRNGDHIELQWPVTDPPWYLQTTTNLALPWQTLGLGTVADGRSYFWRSPLGAGPQFWTLRPSLKNCFALSGLEPGPITNPWEPTGADLRLESFDTGDHSLPNQTIAREIDATGLRILGRLDIDLLAGCFQVSAKVWQSEAFTVEVYENPDAAPLVYEYAKPEVAGIADLVFRGIGRPLSRLRIRSALKPALLVELCCSGARLAFDPAGSGVCLPLEDWPVGPIANGTERDGIRFDAFGAAGETLTDTRIGYEEPFPAYVGFHIQHTLELELARPCSRVTLRLFEQSGLVDCIAFNEGRELARHRVSGVSTIPQDVELSGMGLPITHLRIVSPNDRTVLMQICCVPWIALDRCRNPWELAFSPVTNPPVLSDATLTFFGEIPLRPPDLRVVGGETGFQLTRELELLFTLDQSAVHLRLIVDVGGAPVLSAESFQSDGSLIERIEPFPVGSGIQVLNLDGPRLRRVNLKLAEGKAIITDICTPR